MNNKMSENIIKLNIINKKKEIIETRDLDISKVKYKTFTPLVEHNFNKNNVLSYEIGPELFDIILNVAYKEKIENIFEVNDFHEIEKLNFVLNYFGLPSFEKGKFSLNDKYFSHMFLEILNNITKIHNEMKKIL